MNVEKFVCKIFKIVETNLKSLYNFEIRLFNSFLQVKSIWIMHVEFMIQNPPSFVYEEQLILSY